MIKSCCKNFIYLTHTAALNHSDNLIVIATIFVIISVMCTMVIAAVHNIYFSAHEQLKPIENRNDQHYGE